MSRAITSHFFDDQEHDTALLGGPSGADMGWNVAGRPGERVGNLAAGVADPVVASADDSLVIAASDYRRLAEFDIAFAEAPGSGKILVLCAERGADDDGVATGRVLFQRWRPPKRDVSVNPSRASAILNVSDGSHSVQPPASCNGSAP